MFENIATSIVCHSFLRHDEESLCRPNLKKWISWFTLADQGKFLVKSDFYVYNKYRHRDRDAIYIDRFKGCPEIYPYSSWLFYVK